MHRATRKNGSPALPALLAIGLAALILLGIGHACSVLTEGVVTGVGLSTYLSLDEDMLAAEAAYCAMEDDLRGRIDAFEQADGYDEVRYELDRIGHDPYVLISTLTALMRRQWTIEEVTGLLEMLFARQYELHTDVQTEMRTQRERRTVTNEDGSRETVMENVEVAYTVCTVTLENHDLSHLPVQIMTRDQLALYATYMATLGNRPDLFGSSEYVDLYYGAAAEKYDIPAEALEDEAFAAMIREAEKYLGYPYVWGGSEPSTSFDCSGFVCWVVNHCGVGWNIGRRSAEGIRQICGYVNPADAKPGDLIFFEKTYDEIGASHIGIYVGNGMMIHCGDPIQYTSIESSYYREHFMQFGRLPAP